MGKYLPEQTISFRVYHDGTDQIGVATIDLSESSSIASGQIELPVKITIPNKGLVWASGNYRAIISIQEVGTDAETESE